LIFVGTGATSAVNLLVNKLRVKEKCQTFVQRQRETEIRQKLASIDQSLVENFFPSTESQDSALNFCKRNRWNSYDCTLCKVILPSIGVYEKHAKTQLHLRAVECEVTRKRDEAEVNALPVVFVSAYEHNSNLLPWRETGARVVVIPITDNGDFDYEALEANLRTHASERCLKVGAFCAGSNLTGTLFDTDRISIICHQYGCLATFDYAAAAPYVEINMNGPSSLRRFAFDV